MDERPWLVVGLGNPGAQYAGNRHNVGRMVLDELARRMGVRFSRHRTNAFVAEGRETPGGTRFLLAAPETYMNESGRPVGRLVTFYSLTPDRLIVVHDELDIPFGALRLKAGGGHGGHNGVRDIAAVLGTPEFARVRVGIGRPPGRQPAADFVLRDFTPAERKELPLLVGDAADAVLALAADVLAAAQQRFNAGPPA
ncbi:MAG: aminoacyl-tRNA hydrolase [Amnibacterium sp.]